MNHDGFNTLKNLPVDFHCHGIGCYDFTDFQHLDLDDIESILARRGHRTMLTLYLFREYLPDFIDFMKRYAALKKQGHYDHIAGIALEGPLLASHGGTPKKATWLPTLEEWRLLASCGQYGLVYNIISPDGDFGELNLQQVCKILLEGGVLPAPGHFVKTDPADSAHSLKIMLDFVVSSGRAPTITDHFLNDMPHLFKHAWRTNKEREHRKEDLEQVHLELWSLDKVRELLGPVPAVFIEYARKGLVKICQNFDGDHVDLAIVKKVVELVGAANILLMTDSIEGHVLAGRELGAKNDNTLLYQENGVVAAGTQGIDIQVRNMRRIGLTEREIDLITKYVPNNVLDKQANFLDCGVASSF